LQAQAAARGKRKKQVKEESKMDGRMGAAHIAEAVY